MTRSHTEKVKCPDCDDGMVRSIDYYGDHAWDLCFRCKGDNEIEMERTNEQSSL